MKEPTPRPLGKAFDETLHAGLTDSQLMLLGFIAVCGEEGCFTTKADLARKLRISEKTVDRAVKALRNKELLVATPSFSENGSQVANIYKLAWAVGECLSEDQASEGGG